MKKAVVIGAGLAGCEAAYQLANRGINVTLYEMKKHKMSPAHSSENFAELVCSNSLRSNELANAVGLLKEEMRRVGSIIMSSADKTTVPAGGALAVDREDFSKLVTDRIKQNKNITVIDEEITKIPTDVPVIIATGPLTSDALAEEIRKLLGSEYLYFFDAAAPIVTYESIDMDNAYFAARYNRGTPDYINCPLTGEQYTEFYNELVNAKLAHLHSFDKEKLIVFDGCMPIEEMARRGEMTMLFGPLKPVGLINPKTQKEDYAVIQLRKDNTQGSLYNIVGFQTHLKFSEQKRVFSLIPALKNADFVRYGVMHRNTFINSPKLLDNNFCFKSNHNIYFAGQITGVEGYVESAASGMIAGINLAHKLLEKEPFVFPPHTALYALSAYISDENIKNFQPMNINFGLMPPCDIKIKGKREKNLYLAQKALDELDKIL